MYYPTRYSSYNPVYPIYADELYHHGIKGQRWGHRNGPPYPLNAQTHAAVVRSAGAGDGEKKGRIGSASGKKGGSFFQYNRNTGLATDPMGRWQQRHGYRDADSLYTKKGKRAAAALAAAGGAAYGLASGATSLAAAKRLGIPASKEAKAALLAAGALGGAAGGALGGRLGAGLQNFTRKRIYGPVNKAILGGNKKGHVGSSNAMSDAEKKAKRKKMLRNLAIGAGGAALAGGAAYALAKKGGYNYQSRGMLNGKPAVGLGRHLATEGKRVAKYAGAGAKSLIPKRASRTAIVPYSGGSVPAIRSAANKGNRKAIARNIAIGTGAAAGLGGAIYGGSKIRNNLKRAGDTSWVRRRKRRRR